MRSFTLSVGLAGAAVGWPLWCAAQAAVNSTLPLAVWVATGNLQYTSQERSSSGLVINREQGSLPLIEMGWRWTHGDWFAQGSALRAAHDVRYQGVTQAGFALDTRTDLALVQWQLLGGWRTELAPQQTLELTAGVQQRRLDRFIRPAAGSLALQEVLHTRHAVLGAVWQQSWLQGLPKPVHLRAAAQWQPSLKQRLDVNSLGVLDDVSVVPGISHDWALGLLGQMDLSDRWSTHLGWTYQAIRPGASNSAVWRKNGVPSATLRYPGSRQSAASWQWGLQAQF
jgi:hypothetical protein